jgi:hypothetical protein
MCSGENCWWPSRTASDCADWIKPRARSVYFSIFIAYFPQPAAQPGARSAKVGTGFASITPHHSLARISRDAPAAQPRRHCCGIFIGFPQAALTFLNQPAVVAIIL